MAATNFTPIQLYYSTTASAAPAAGNLANGELAINITDGKLFYKDNGGTVQVLATKDTGTIGGSNTQVQYNSSGALAGSSNFTFNGTTATINTLNLTNALGTTYGGTGLNSYTTGDLMYASASNTLSKLTIGTNGYILTSNGTIPTWTAGSSISVNTATNLAGGATGSVPYQSGAGATTFLSIGSANTVLTSSGTGPQWVTSLSSLTGVSSSSMTNTSLTSGRVVYSTTGGAQTDSASLTFNGTTLTAGGFATGGSSTLDKLVKIGDSAFNLPAVLSATAPAKLYVSTATVTDASSAAGATNVLGTIASLGSTTVAASNTGVTYTNLATLYIAGAPTAGTNVTITNPYALYVAGGNSIFSTSVTIGFGANSATLNLNANTASAGVSNQVLFQAAGTSKWALGGGNIGSGDVNDFGIYNYVTATNWLIVKTASNDALFSNKASFNGASILSGITVKDSLAITAATGTQYFLMGNQDSSGANKPLVLSSGNATLLIGYGNSWSSATGGTVTNLFAFTPTGRLGVNNSSPSYTLDVTGDARISTKGYIGTTPISNAILSVGGTGTEATDLATARTTAAFMMTPYSGSAWALAIGSASGQIPYFQGIDSGSATARNISLQPYGENVGVGTTSPAASSGLHIYGTRTLVRPVIQSYNATTSAEPSIKLSSGTTTEYSAYWGILGGTAASYAYFDNRTGTGNTYWQVSGSNAMIQYANSGSPYLDIGTVGLVTGGGASGLRLQVLNGMAFGGGAVGSYGFGTIRQNTSSPYETIITANAYPANIGANSAVWIRSGTSGGGGPAELAYFRSDGVNFINTTSGGASELNIRHPNGSSSGSLSLTSSSAGGGGASYILMGNNDSGGATGPNVIVSANRALQFGVGDSFASRTGGTFTEWWRMDSGQLRRTMTADGTAIRVLGSYSGNPEMVAIGQTSSDGFINIKDAAGNTTYLQGYNVGTSYFSGRLRVNASGSNSNAKLFVNGNSAFGNTSTGDGVVFAAPARVDYSSSNGPTSWTIRFSGTSMGEYYIKIFFVGLNPYTGTGYVTYTMEATGYLDSGIGTVISSAETPNSSYTFASPTFAAGQINIAMTSNGNTNYRFSVHAMVVTSGGADRAMSMSVV